MAHTSGQVDPKSPPPFSVYSVCGIDPNRPSLAKWCSRDRESQAVEQQPDPDNCGAFVSSFSHKGCS